MENTDCSRISINETHKISIDSHHFFHQRVLSLVSGFDTLNVDPMDFWGNLGLPIRNLFHFNQTALVTLVLLQNLI